MTPIETISAIAIVITAFIVYYFILHPPHRHKWKTTDITDTDIYAFSYSESPYRIRRTATLTCTSCGEVKFVTTTL